MKYKYPLSYAATKTMANIIHGMAVPRAVRTALWQQRLLEIRPEVQTSQRSVTFPEMALPSPPVVSHGNQYPPAGDEAPISKARSAKPSLETPFFKESHHVWTNRSSRPAALKRSGGLRGSTATR